MGRRRKARELAVQMVYQHDLGGLGLDEVLRDFSPHDLAPEVTSGKTRGPKIDDSLDYARELARGAVEHRPRVDDLIEAGSTNWRLVRMSAVDRSILRVAVYELLFESDVPHIVVVDEAIELAKRFGSEQSAGFVNGVLDGLIRAKKFPGRLK